MKSSWKYILLTGLVTILSCGRIITKERIIIPKIEEKEKSEIELVTNNDREIIFEGTVITSKRVFYKNIIYTSCVVEVNRIFKGEIDERVIEIFVMGGSIGDMSVSLSHGQILLPPKNSTAIFRVKENFTKELIELTPFKLYSGTDRVIPIFSKSYNSYSRINIEKEVYQKLETEAGRKRENIFLPQTFDEVAIKYSIKNRLLLPNRKRGIVYKLTPVQETEKKNYIGFNVQISSTNSVSYFDNGELIIEYNEKAFGDSIVSNGKLIYEIPRNYQIGNTARYSAIPEHFEVTLNDITSNRFKIKWKNKEGTDNYLQLLPQKGGIHSATLYFSPIIEEEQINLKLIGVDTSNLQYDYELKEVVPFEYTATDEILYYQAKDLLPATITEIYPNKIFQPGDTVQLRGKNFMQYSEIAFYTKAKSGHYRYRKAPTNYILSKTDTLIQMIIPHLALRNGSSDLSEEWYPTSGKIKITKGYGQFKVMTWSKENIKIKNTAPNKSNNVQRR